MIVFRKKFNNVERGSYDPLKNCINYQRDN